MLRVLPKSFFAQLLLGTFLVQTLFLGLFIWYTVVTQTRIAEGRARDRIVQQLQRLSAACSDELAKNDLKSLQEKLELSRIAPTIAVARLTDLTGRTIAVTENAQDRGLDASEVAVLPNANKPQIFRDKNRQLEGVDPVRVNGTVVALLWLEPNQTLASSTTTVVVRIAMTYGGFALLANLLPIFLIVRTMTRPLQALRAATDRVVRGPDLRTGFPLPVTTRNEAGDLTVSFNSMVRELEEQRKGLLETLALLDSMLICHPSLSVSHSSSRSILAFGTDGAGRSTVEDLNLTRI
jgi:HAMP domain-containing protein